jgi:hypothetical protein
MVMQNTQTQDLQGAQSAPAAEGPLFKSFFIGGFECSTHKIQGGRRLDLLASTRHDALTEQDYRRLQSQGIKVARDGVRWHLVERRPGRYNWSSVVPMLQAAQTTGMQVIWDLWHYGWPDDIDVFSAEFVRRLALFARAFARVVSEETEGPYFFTPVNEISFFSWAASGSGWFPHSYGRADELKQQLARAAIESIEAVWSVVPGARIVHTDPLINVIPNPRRPHTQPHAAGWTEAQYQGLDMISGRRWTYLGGHPKYVDIIGANYYDHNQWILDGRHVFLGDRLYKPFREMLAELYRRYERPIFIAETGAEGDNRVPWMRYVGAEVQAARASGVPVEGICIYPILDYPGWEDDRHCPAGLWGYPDSSGDRPLYEPLAEELAAQRVVFEGAAGYE